MNTEQLAARQFNRAIEINDKIVDAYLGLAAAHKLAGRTEEAIGTLALASAIQPNSTFLFAETAKLILKAALEADILTLPDGVTNYDEAIYLAHQRHLAACPNNPDLHYRLGLLRMNISKFDEAVELFSAALRINPTFRRAAVNLAVCLNETGRQAEALEQIMPTPAYDPATLELYYQTALLYANRVKFASSLLNLRRQIESNLATDLDPGTNISIVLQNLGMCDTVGLTWENLCETAAHAAPAAIR
jgi:tetratricopeptide (TPR) repeat protein